MAAVIDIRTGARISPEAKRRLRPESLIVLSGGRSPGVRRMRRIYMFRRVVAAVGFLLVTSTALLVGYQVLAAFDVAGGASSAVVQGASVSPGSYVVRSGDTLWSLANRLAPEADPREVVSQIVDTNVRAGAEMTADTKLQVGQILRLPDID